MRQSLLVCAAIALAPSFMLAQQGQVPITTSAPDALALYQKALDYVENFEPNSARPLLDQAIQRDPDFAMAHALRCYLEEAVSLADKVSPGERHWIMAMQAVSDGDVPKMKEHVAELLKLHPTDKHAVYAAGNMMQAVNDDEALALYKRATAIDPTFAAAYNQIGYVHIRKGDLGGAEQALKQYIATRPDSPNPYDSYAELLLRMGRYDESIAQYEKALTKAPDFSGPLVGIGHNHVFKGDYAKARASYGRLHDTGRSAQNRLSGLHWIAVSFVHEGKTAEALLALEKWRDLALKAGPVTLAMYAHMEQAVLLSVSGKAAEAKAHLDQAEAMIGGTPSTDAEKTRWSRDLLLARTLAAAQARDFAAARSSLERLKTEITSDLPVEWKERYEAVAGTVDLLEGNHDAALPHLEQASPENPLALFYRAEALRLKGDAAGAAAMYKRVVALNANSMGYALVRSRAMKWAQP